jgi:uncharacterized protein involved in oxidation of intracellular sulfur
MRTFILRSERSAQAADTRGITEGELAEGSHRSTLDQLADWTQWADKTLVF